ncbi:MAG: DUF4258 domain-containing protein [Nanoarchaeota archaeon]|nr:DUF4258 domain-containing protein [Nanoarchaeota archaeon]MBU1103402.1 DUF4258 domain-containing protein [Nanoarchaeota archaeon]
MEYIFTDHSKYRIRKRDLSLEEIIDAIKHADKILKKYGKYYAQKNIGRGTIEIVYEKTESYIRVITVYWI